MKTITKEIEAYLTSKYGKIEEQWRVQLQLLYDDIELYNKCKKAIAEQGLILKNGVRNPLLTTMKEFQSNIMKISQHFGLTPYSVSKIKSAVSDADDYIDELIS